MKNSSVSTPATAAHHDLRRACEKLDALTTILDGLAVGIFTTNPLRAAGTGQAEAEAVARAITREKPAAARPSRDTTCRCRNCGKEMKLSETVNFYGIPACPICVHAAKPFDVLIEPMESDTANS
jgi:hypothetical protein